MSGNRVFENADGDVLYIVVPAYNEQENIGRLIDDWYPVVERHSGNGRSRLVIVNDGSRDRTGEIIEEYAETRPLLKQIRKPNGGHGSALMKGYGCAVSAGADYIFQTDSDGQTLPREFESFWNLREYYDAVIGNRWAREDGIGRIFVEQTLLFILRVIFGVRMPDANAPFRLMKRELLEKYLGRMPADYNLPNVMLTTFFVRSHEKVCFRKITFRPRQAGKNSINPKKIVKIGWKALGDFVKFRFQNG
ncbi:MAG: glycosyltransferase family 2 protein [Lachnospiraceae bacterium]|nr:glycosyltransferase family 2 protein [Lachnospiraceae bacterium]